MGSSKAAAMRLMIDTFCLQVSETDYLEECSRMEVGRVCLPELSFNHFNYAV